MTLERDVAILRMTSTGSIDPDCETCQRFFLGEPDPAMVFAPRHKASERCESGKHPHCTCDSCW
jgi:hypothetical protein